MRDDYVFNEEEITNLMFNEEFHHLFHRTTREVGTESMTDIMTSIFRRANKQLAREEADELKKGDR